MTIESSQQQQQHRHQYHHRRCCQWEHSTAAAAKAPVKLFCVSARLTLNKTVQVEIYLSRGELRVSQGFFYYCTFKESSAETNNPDRQIVSACICRRWSIAVEEATESRPSPTHSCGVALLRH